MNGTATQVVGEVLFWLVIAAIAIAGLSIWARHHRAYLDAIAAFRWDPNMSPTEFERLCADFLALKGWSERTTRGSGDQDVGVLAEKAGVRVVIQCKKYSRPVGNKAVQEAHAAKAFAHAHMAAVVSNMGYTPAARTLTKGNGVLLLHFTDLANADYLFGLSAGPAARNNGTGDASFFDPPSQTRHSVGDASFSDHSPPVSRAQRHCPKCRAILRLPKGRTGTVRCPECGRPFTAKT